MKRMAALILMALCTLSFVACGSQQDTKSASEITSVTTQSNIKQDKVQNGSSVTTSNPDVLTITTPTSSKSTSATPNAKFAGKPVPKQQMDSTTKDLKNTMSQIQSTINSLDTASDVNTDDVQ